MDQNSHYTIALIVRNVIKKVKKIICFIVIDANSATLDRKKSILTVKIVTNAIKAVKKNIFIVFAA